MAASVVIVDYGIGNLKSAQRAFAHCGADAVLSPDPDRIASADRLVVPGVGAFGDCAHALERSGLKEPVLSVVAAGRPVLGICVGMQLLFDGSEEFGDHVGLGVIPGRVKRIPDMREDGTPQKIPHIGWTPLEIPAEANGKRWAGGILARTAPGTPMYFVHSYTGWPDNPAHRLADAFHGGRRIAAAVAMDNVTGTQFHPEKSGPAGLALISAFIA